MVRLRRMRSALGWTRWVSDHLTRVELTHSFSQSCSRVQIAVLFNLASGMRPRRPSSSLSNKSRHFPPDNDVLDSIVTLRGLEIVQANSQKQRPTGNSFGRPFIVACIAGSLEVFGWPALALPAVRMCPPCHRQESLLRYTQLNDSLSARSPISTHRSHPCWGARMTMYVHVGASERQTQCVKYAFLITGSIL
jgi:hypothetical protein